MRYSCASLRADSWTQAVVDGLAESGQRRVLLHLAGSERLRLVINKGISEENLRTAAQLSLLSPWYSTYGLYIMIGLPTKRMKI